jgi:hypothetical protein
MDLCGRPRVEGGSMGLTVGGGGGDGGGGGGGIVV